MLLDGWEVLFLLLVIAAASTSTSSSPSHSPPPQKEASQESTSTHSSTPKIHAPTLTNPPTNPPTNQPTNQPPNPKPPNERSSSSPAPAPTHPHQSSPPALLGRYVDFCPPILPNKSQQRGSAAHASHHKKQHRQRQSQSEKTSHCLPRARSVGSRKSEVGWPRREKASERGSKRRPLASSLCRGVAWRAGWLG
ncbi:hypothetical protein IWX90DRAFT_209554 [Phyllosticta citrichinensis]|uniref:Uncharacterized protein n=1 Tax=Phyllosticta citrichinensis TaxID=1130410 RepID=A0ABR1XT01_9PEZI